MQVPAPFDYERATSVEHALALLERLGPEARLLAGGHWLLPMMKLRLAAPEHLIDINALAGELGYIRERGRRGAHRRDDPPPRRCSSPSCSRERLPDLHRRRAVIADPVVRNRGTIGGALCQADPSEDLSAVCAALGAQRRDPRRAAASASSACASSTAARTRPRSATAEMLVEVRVPLRATARQRLREGRAPRGRLGGRGRGRRAAARRRRRSPTPASRSTAVGADARPLDARRGGARRPARRRRRRSPRPAGLAAEDCDPTADQRGPADYKRHLAGELTHRALRRAAARRAGDEEADVQVTMTVNGEEHTRGRRAAAAARALPARRRSA